MSYKVPVVAPAIKHALQANVALNPVRREQDETISVAVDGRSWLRDFNSRPDLDHTNESERYNLQVVLRNAGGEP